MTRLVRRLVRAQLVLAMLALMAMGSVTVADVFFKYAFNSPIVGAYDLVESLLPVVIFNGLPATILRRQSITIDLVDGFVGTRLVNFLTRLADLVVLFLLIAIMAAMVPAARQALEYGDRKVELGLPVIAIWATTLLGILGAILASAAVSLGVAAPTRKGA